jgi:phage I-like protein
MADCYRRPLAPEWARSVPAMNKASLFTAFVDPGVPEWVHLMPAGTFRAKDGRGPFSLKNPGGVIAASMAGGKLPLDENHSTELAPNLGQPSPAHGWIVGMEVRDDGIWGRVEWNASGQTLMTNTSYSGISPVFHHDKAGTVLRITSAALTNNPALGDLKSLNTLENPMDLAPYRRALGLADDADETAILAAVTANTTAATVQGVRMTALATAAGLKADLAPDVVFAALQARVAGGGDVGTLMATTARLEAELMTLRADTGKVAATSMVDRMIRAGKPINALREIYIVRATADLAGIEAELKLLPSINGAGVARMAGEGGEGNSDADLTGVEKEVAARMGLDPMKLLEARKARSAGNGGAA